MGERTAANARVTRAHEAARPPAPGASKPALEHSILYTATLCLLAVGAVMVYSASSAESLLDGTGDPSRFLKRYLVLGGVGLVAMHAVSRAGPGLVRRATPAALLVSFALTAAVLVPGLGVTVNGATRWLGAGPLQFQPSEPLKVALVLYAAQLLAARPNALRTLGGLCKPLLLVVGVACALLLAQPDMGTAIVICASIGALLVAAGARTGHLAGIAASLTLAAFVVAIVEPYRRERLTSFLDPWADAGDSGFQAVQAMIAIGSGGVFGVGLGESVQKVFYLPEAHTDMILAIIGEELGLAGLIGVVALYGMIAYAGLRAAKLAADRYSKLLAAGITSLILCQATLNLFAVMGMAPLTGVPLPFISFGNSNLVVLLAGMGVVLNVAAGARAQPVAAGRRLRAIAGGAQAQRERAEAGAVRGGREPDAGRRPVAGPDSDRGRRDGGARGPGAGRRRRAVG